jgi:predicted transcriptional regulator of viral defense system
MRSNLHALLKNSPIQRTQDLESLGISRTQLRLHVANGILENPSRGLYIASNAAVSENRSLAEVCKRIPNGVICLISALRFHNLTTQSPHEIWIALERSSWKPKIDHIALRFTRFSGPAFDEGQDHHVIDGVPIKITSPAKTVADCFKYRNKIGLDVAMEALREARRKRLCTIEALMHFAHICRVANVMKPYLESMS